MSFDVDRWLGTYSFKYGDGDGTLGSDDIMINSILNRNDVFTTKACEKPIIKRSGISKLMKRFDFVEQDVKIFPIPAIDDSCKSIIFAMVYLVDQNAKAPGTEFGRTFCGDGEASEKNLEKSKIPNRLSISEMYPIAMACKRARSRAVLNYLGIDAYGEDEAPTFKDISIEDLKDLDQDKINVIEELHGETFARKQLVDYFRSSLKSVVPAMSGQEAKELSCKILFGPNTSSSAIDSFKFTNLSIDELIKLIAGLEIYKQMDPETASKCFAKINQQ